MCFFRKRKKKKQAELEEQKRLNVEKVEVKQEVDNSPAEKTEKTQEKTTVVEKKSDEKPVVKAETKPDLKTETKETEVETDHKEVKAAKYHVSQNKDDKSEFFKQWRVRKQGSQKTIKYFHTQAEAIDYAQDLADKAGSSIVIHKLDGSIRKQDYTKK